MRYSGWALTGFGVALVLTMLGGCGRQATQPLASIAPALTRALTPTVPAAATAMPTATGTDLPTPTVSASPTSTTNSVATSTQTPIPPTATSTATLTATSTLSPLPPTPTSTPTPIPPTVTIAPPATASPPPTATPKAHRYYPAGPAVPDPSNPCPGCPRAPAYIVGRIRDAAGSPLVGVRLVCYNEWYRYPIVASKVDGEYDFPITQANTTWYVVVLGQEDQPLSPEVPVPFDLDQSCRYILDWRRVD